MRQAYPLMRMSIVACSEHVRPVKLSELQNNRYRSSLLTLPINESSMTPRVNPLFALAAAAHLGALVASGDDLPISNFQGTDYGNWKATGTAFQKGPITGDTLAKLEIENAVGPVASSEVDGDQPTGTLTSPSFPDRKSTRLNSSHPSKSRMPSSA